MLDQRALRSTDYREGTEIRLADGQCWTFPAPGGMSGPESPAADPNYLPILEAILDAEDTPDRLRSELVLAIHLLGRNYRLRPREYRKLLGFPAGSPALAAAQHAFHELATQHLRANLVNAEVGPAAARPSGFLTRAWARLGSLLGVRRTSKPSRAGSIQLDA